MQGYGHLEHALKNKAEKISTVIAIKNALCFMSLKVEVEKYTIQVTNFSNRDFENFLDV